MAKDKKSFIAYADWKDTFDALPNDKAGELIKHIFAYVNDEDPKTDDVLINAVFCNIKNALKRDLDKWEKQHQQRIKAGKKSAEVRKRNAEAVNDRSISSTDNVSVSVSDNVSVNDIKKEKVYSKEIHDTLFECLKHFPIHLHPKNKDSWLDVIDKLNRIDLLPLEKITEVVKSTRADDFWSKNFLSLTKLRQTNKEGVKYIVVFNEQTKNNGISKNKSNKSTAEMYAEQQARYAGKGI